MANEMGDKPCCAEAAARRIRHLVIDGSPIGVARLDDIMSEVRGMSLPGDEEIAEALLKKVKIFNYVPSSASSEYKQALLEEYRRKG